MKNMLEKCLFHHKTEELSSISSRPSRTEACKKTTVTRGAKFCVVKPGTRTQVLWGLGSPFLRICSGCSWLSLACPDQTLSPSTARTLIMRGREAAAWSALFFPPPQISAAQTVGHYGGWLVKGPIDLQQTGGKSHMDSGSREGTLTEVHLEVRRSSQTPPTHFLCRDRRCRADLAPLGLFSVCVLFNPGK